MITDTQIIDTLKNIKEHCSNYKNCENCKFKLEGNDESNFSCQIGRLACRLSNHIPEHWDIDDLERIIKQ